MAETTPSPQHIRARVAVSLVAVAVSVVVLARWALMAASMLKSGGRYDFSTYYAAAYALRRNPHANIYDAHVLAQAGAAAHTFVNPPLAYTYPPLFAILLSPFTVFSFKVLAALWQVMNDALWLLIALILAREIFLLLRGRIPLPAVRPNQRWSLLETLAAPTPLVALVALALALLLCLPNEPGIQTALTGQINFLVLLPLALVPELERRGHPRWAGALIAIAAMLKFTPAILLLYFVLRRRWLVVFAALVALAVLIAFCVAIVGPGVTLASVPQALHVGTSDASISHNEALLAPLLAALTAAHPSAQSLFHGLEYAVLALLALVVGFILWRRWRPVDDTVADHEKDVAGYGVALCLMVLLWPTAWVHHYVWALPAATVALALVMARLLDARLPGAIVRMVGLLLLTSLCCFMLVVTLPHHWDTMVSPEATAYLGLPLRPLMLTLRALGTLGLLGLLAYWYSTARARNSGDAHDMLRKSARASGKTESMWRVHGKDK